MEKEKILITGGAGFIGSNLANNLIGQGHRVIIFDNLSRSGCDSNLAWLQQNHGSNSFQLIKSSVSDFDAIKNAAQGVDRLYHLAGQVAVTTSTTNPRQDFLDNAMGTFNALEAARLVGNDPIFIYSSTNKVYGGMEDVKIIEEAKRYQYVDLPFGISEDFSLDFHSPYGCSKGAGDQYTRDYARIFGLRTVVARQSCIYGYRQFGIEDQGWLAWFIIAAQKGLPITLYGNGKQVRDILFIDDLINFYDAVVKNISIAAGQIYNVGGGFENSVSIWCEFSEMLEELIGDRIQVKYSDWRSGDQPVYISDIRKAAHDLGWTPKISAKKGIRFLYEWIKENQELFSHLV
jgi:CDP-paratose 2-epimerase